jgi:hypothetical protein
MLPSEKSDYRSLNEEEWQTKMRSDDRVLVLAPIDGTKPKSSIGIVDPKLFTGENKLHAIRNPNFSWWTLKYEHGGVPPVLQQTFMSFEDLLTFTKEYFKTRNIQIVDVKDSYERG